MRFEQIAKWRSPVELLRSAEFIVASRPGFPLGRCGPGAARMSCGRARPEARKLLETGSLETNGATIHLLPDVNEEVSATAIREAARQREMDWKNWCRAPWPSTSPS